MSLTYGSLFTGYNGLSMGIQSVLPGRTAWVAETDKAASRLLAHRYPTTPNLGDVTAIRWDDVEPVDVLDGGSPCQDLSHAGQRKGMTDGTRSNLWESMREGIAVIRPRLVVWENVRGALSAPASSTVEQCPGCVGNRAGQSPLRALGRVLGDLADLGYDARWYGLRAADVGAAHGRFRLFVFATPADAGCLPGGLQVAGQQPAIALPPSDGDSGGAGLTLLPTPTAADHRSSGGGYTQDNVTLTDATARGRRPWSIYREAIENGQRMTGRAAPAPTETDANGKTRLSPRFVEWMMGLPAGHVTDPAMGLTTNQQLKMLGNGVVPQQAAAATRAFVTDDTNARLTFTAAEEVGVALPA